MSTFHAALWSHSDDERNNFFISFFLLFRSCLYCFVLLAVTALLELETQAFRYAFDDICKSVYVTNKLWFLIWSSKCYVPRACVYVCVCMSLGSAVYWGPDQTTVAYKHILSIFHYRSTTRSPTALPLSYLSPKIERLLFNILKFNIQIEHECWFLCLNE